MFLTRLGQTWLFCYNIIPYHNPFLSYAALLRYLRRTFIPSPYKHIFITLLFFIKMQLSLCSFSCLEIKYFTSYIFFRIAFFSGVLKKITFYCIGNNPAALEGLYFFGLIICFISFPFYSLVSFLEFWESILLLCRRNMFYHFFCFRVIAFASLHIYYLTVFVLIMYLQCNIFICLRYRWRTIFLRLISMFFRIAFVSDTWEEPFYFVLRLCFSVFYLSQISEKIHITSP